MFRLYILGIILLFTSVKAFCFSEKDDNIEVLKMEARAHLYKNPLVALQIADQAHQIAVNINDSSLIFRTRMLLGSIYSLSGIFDLALESYLDAEDYLDQNDSFTVADFNINMASMYYHLNDFSKAHDMNDESLNAYHQMNDSVGMAWCLNLRGLIEIKQCNYSRAKVALDSALYLHKQLNNQIHINIILNNMTLIPGDEDTHIEMLNELIRFSELNDMKWVLAENYNNLGLAYYRKNDFVKSRYCLRVAKAKADSLHANIIIRDNLLLLNEIAVKEQNYEEAYGIRLTLDSIYNQIYSLSNIRRIAEGTFKKRQLKHLRKIAQNENDLRVARREKLIVFLSCGFLIIIIILIIRIYHLRKVNRLISHVENETQKKSELKKQLEHKEDVILNQTEILNISKKEMTDLVYFIKSKDKLLDNVISMLQEAQKKTADDPRVKIKSIVALIKNFKDKELKTDLFINEINKHEQAFLERLKVAHEDLSKNEIILATLLRIGLSSKEIALLIDSNPKTVNMARYRLRKKLSLDTDENLVSYFETM
ncbi:MAG: hypothetical protein ACRCXN_12400 [Bacteroidales bacterium]